MGYGSNGLDKLLALALQLLGCFLLGLLLLADLLLLDGLAAVVAKADEERHANDQNPEDFDQNNQRLLVLFSVCCHLIIHFLFLSAL